MKKEKVLVVFNATGPTTIDQDYSKQWDTKDWYTETDVVGALDYLEHDHDILGIFDDTEIIAEKIRQFEPTVVFNLVERFRNDTSHDRDIASYFKLLDIPFTGCGPTGLTLSKNKGLSKKILTYHKIRVPEFTVLFRRRKVKRPARLKFPIIVKPLEEEASMGIAQASVVDTDDQFRERVRFVHENMDQDVIAEEYIEGRELYVSLVGNKRLTVFPVREMRFADVPADEPKFASYKAKWDEKYRKKWGIRNQFAGSLPAGIPEKIEKISKKIYHVLSLRGYARLDMRLTPGGELVFLEANPNPMLAMDEDFAESAERGGLDYPQLIQRILNLARPGIAD